MDWARDWLELHRLEHWLALRGGFVEVARIIRLTDIPVVAAEVDRIEKEAP